MGLRHCIPEVLNLNKPRHFENIGGRSSDGTMPFFEVKSGGRSAMVAIGWTGNWKAVFTSVEDGIRVQTGLQNAQFYLKPGESLRTSSTLVMISEPGEDVSNRFRRLIRDHFSHLACTPATREGLLAFELWGGLPSAEMIKRLKQLHEHGIRLEDVWIDAGWYGQCTKCDEPFSGDWSRFTGEWTINPRVHPNLLQDVAKTANDIGMKLRPAPACRFRKSIRNGSLPATAPKAKSSTTAMKTPSSTCWKPFQTTSSP